MSARQSRFYRVLLHAYPRSFRREYAEEMMRLFSDRADASDGHVWAWALRDALQSAPRLRWEEGSLRTSLAAGVAVSILSVAIAAAFIGARTPGQLVVWALAFSGVLATLFLVPAWVGRRFGRPTESVYRERARRGFVWWLVPAGVLALADLWLGVGSLIEDPKIENLLAMIVFAGFAAAVVGGIILRGKDRNAGNVLIVVGVVPAGTFIWVVFPPILAIPVIVAALVEIGATGRAAPQAP